MKKRKNDGGRTVWLMADFASLYRECPFVPAFRKTAGRRVCGSDQRSHGINLLSSACPPPSPISPIARLIRIFLSNYFSNHDFCSLGRIEYSFTRGILKYSLSISSRCLCLSVVISGITFVLRISCIVPRFIHFFFCIKNTTIGKYSTKVKAKADNISIRNNWDWEDGSIGWKKISRCLERGNASLYSWIVVKSGKSEPLENWSANNRGLVAMNDIIRYIKSSNLFSGLYNLLLNNY